MADDTNENEQIEETPVAAEPATDEVEAVADETPVEAVQAEADEPPAAAPEDVVSTDEPAEEPAEEPTEQPAEAPVEVAAEAEVEPASDAEPSSEEAPEPETPAASARRKKKKRLPRALRQPRTKPKREKPAERKPISRLPKPEHVRGRSQERQGTVVSAAMDKTIVVRVDLVKIHPRYKKVIRRSSRFHAHDEHNEAKVGDVVLIVETRPLSRLKRWRLQQIVEAAR
jgi:small subunit ribosomal protein S17